MLFVRDPVSGAGRTSDAWHHPLIILLLLLIGALPTWPYSRGWGYYPTGGLGLVLIIILILLLMGRI